MNKKLKIGLIALGSVTAIVVTSVLVSKAVKNKKLKRKLEEEEKEKAETLRVIQANLGTSAPSEAVYNPQSAKVVPIRNFNKEIINPLSEIRGVVVRPAQKSSDAEKGHVAATGKTNIRTSPEVNSAGSHWSGLDSGNLAGTINGDNAFGVILDEAFDDMSPKMRWFEVCLIKSIRDCSGYGIFGSQCETIVRGWVRADTVTFKAFDRPSKDMLTTNRTKCMSPFGSGEIVGIDGSKSQMLGNSAIIQYKKRDMLGAEVFPHTNWLNPIVPQQRIAPSFEFDDVLDL